MTIIDASQHLRQLFDENWLNKTAKQQGFCKRLRDIRPLELVSSQVSALGDGKVDAIADLHRSFNGIHMDTRAGVAYKPFHNQLRKAEFADFMQVVTCRAMALFKQELCLALPEKLKRFEQVLLQDGSSFALHPDLAEIFPNRFKGHSPAGVECHMTMSLADAQPIKLGISADTASERDYLPKAEQMTHKLLLADAGYIGLKYMADIERNNGFYLMRATKQINPTITRALHSKGKEVKALAGLKLKDLKQRRGARTQVLDLDVQWQRHDCRMVLFWHKKEKRYLWWLTNLPREEFSGEDVMKLYRIRWQIELLFKEWKSHNNLKKFVTRQPYLVKGLIWASLLSLLLKRYIGRIAQRRLKVRLSMLKIAKSTQGWFEPVMKSLASKSITQLKADLGWAITFITKNCCRAQQSKARQDNSLESIFEHLNA
jgi:hypothetical protein